MAIGTVKFFNRTKGFGFIIPEDGGKDVFVHRAAVEMAGMQTLNVGQRLSFETERDARGTVKAAKLEPHSKGSVSVLTEESLTPSINAHQRPAHHNPKRELLRGPSATIRDAGETELQRNAKVPNRSGEWQRSYDRYCDLARNAGDDVIARENYWQHAEHFLRMVNGSAN